MLKSIRSKTVPWVENPRNLDLEKFSSRFLVPKIEVAVTPKNCRKGEKGEKMESDDLWFSWSCRYKYMCIYRYIYICICTHTSRSFQTSLNQLCTTNWYVWPQYSLQYILGKITSVNLGTCLDSSKTQWLHESWSFSSKHGKRLVVSYFQRKKTPGWLFDVKTFPV